MNSTMRVYPFGYVRMNIFLLPLLWLCEQSAVRNVLETGSVRSLSLIVYNNNNDGSVSFGIRSHEYIPANSRQYGIYWKPRPVSPFSLIVYKNNSSDGVSFGICSQQYSPAAFMWPCERLVVRSVLGTAPGKSGPSLLIIITNEGVSFGICPHEYTPAAYTKALRTAGCTGYIGCRRLQVNSLIVFVLFNIQRWYFLWEMFA